MSRNSTRRSRARKARKTLAAARHAAELLVGPKRLKTGKLVSGAVVSANISSHGVSTNKITIPRSGLVGSSSNIRLTKGAI